jgi:hypothetical protein
MFQFVELHQRSSEYIQGTVVETFFSSANRGQREGEIPSVSQIHKSATKLFNEIEVRDIYSRIQLRTAGNTCNSDLWHPQHTSSVFSSISLGLRKFSVRRKWKSVSEHSRTGHEFLVDALAQPFHISCVYQKLAAAKSISSLYASTRRAPTCSILKASPRILFTNINRKRYITVIDRTRYTTLTDLHLGYSLPLIDCNEPFLSFSATTGIVSIIIT